MKKKLGIVVFLMLFAMPISLFSQQHDTEERNREANPETEFTDPRAPNLLIQRDNRYGIFSFQLADGTPVSRREVEKLIGIVPANQDLMRQIKRGTITGWITFGLMIATGGAAITYIAGDFYGADIAFPVFMGSSIVMAITSNLVNGKTNKIFLRAVDNYNLHTLDISRGN
jgi:hypothetical protein